MSRHHPHGSGTLYQRTDGRWTAQLQVNGRRVQVYGRTRAEAQGKLDDLCKQALLYGSLPEHQSLHSLLDHYLQVGRDVNAGVKILAFTGLKLPGLLV